MARLQLLLLAVLATVLFAFVSASPSASGEEEMRFLEDAYFGPRLRRVPLAYHGDLQQLLSNLKPRFR